MKDIYKELYGLTTDRIAAMDQIEIDEETGEVLNLEKFNEVEETFLEKIEECLLYAKYIDGKISEAKHRIEDIKSIIEMWDKKKEGLMKLVTGAMERAGKKTYQTSMVDYSWRKSKYCEVLKEEDIPEEYFSIKTKTEIKPDKVKILKELKQGKDIPGVSLGERTTYTLK